jgi:collagenase-like PrtC family protease
MLLNQKSTMAKRFHVGYSGRLEELRRLLGCGIPLESVYTGGLPGKMANIRRHYLADSEVLRQQVGMCHEAGVSMEILVDAPCFTGRHLWVRGQPLFIEYFGQLEEAGVDGVIASDPAMVELVKAHSGLKVGISRVAGVDSIAGARFYETLGADSIILDPVINRQYERLARLVMALDHAQPRLLLNEGCLAECSYRQFHYGLMSHPDTPVAGDYYLMNCTARRLEDPALILSSPFIRPEDLAGYDGLVDHYCLALRSPRRSTSQVAVLAAYVEGRYDGDLLDLMSNRGYPLIRGLAIPNRSLDGAWDEKWRDCLSIGHCDGCRYCAELADRVAGIGRVEEAELPLVAEIRRE